MHFLCKVSSSLKFLTFRLTTALQRCKLFCHSTQLRGDRRRGVARLFPFHRVIVPFSSVDMVQISGKVKSSGSGIVASAARILGSSSGSSFVATVQIIS